MWHQTLASATLGSGGGTALNVSQACDDDAVERFELLNASL